MIEMTTDYEHRDDNDGFYAAWTGACWAVAHEDWEGAWVAFGLQRSQAEYAVQLMASDALGLRVERKMYTMTEIRDRVEEAVESVPCTTCETHFFRQQLRDGACPRCGS